MRALIKAVAVTCLIAFGANAAADHHGNKKDIVDTAIAAGSFNTLVTAVQAADVITLASATTVQGSDVDIELIDGGVKIDGANVVTTDIETSNGVIHVIDAVIMP